MTLALNILALIAIASLCVLLVAGCFLLSCFAIKAGIEVWTEKKEGDFHA